MNYKDYVVERLKGYSEKQIIITSHTLIRLVQRQIDENEIKENILNPKRLKIAIKENASGSDEEKFDCYFEYSKNLCHKYVLVMNDNVIVVTVVKINRRWQMIAEKKMKNHRW
jgi:hypothetical protein